MSSPSSSPSHSAEPSGSSIGSGPSRQPSASSEPKGLLVLIPDRIDVEEEARFYDDIVDSASTVGQDNYPYRQPDSRPLSPVEARSIFSNDIWLGDNSGESNAFARGVEIPGWTSVGDKRGGAYVVYDCVIKTKEGTVIHALKRYSAFAQLYARLRATLPSSQQPFIPSLPPKFPLAKFRPTFLDRRRRLLHHWLSAILLHPDIGGCQAVREWVMDKSRMRWATTSKQVPGKVSNHPGITTNNLSTVLRVYDEVRRPFTQNIAALAKRRGQLHHLDSPELGWLTAERSARGDALNQEQLTEISEKTERCRDWQFGPLVLEESAAALRRLDDALSTSSV